MIKFGKQLLIIFSALLLQISCHQQTIQVGTIRVEADAPFDMPAISIPDFSNCDTFSIPEFGAIQGDKEKTSAAIDKAILAASERGGTVLIPEGTWLCKSIHLKSNVNLHLAKNAVLLFSEKPADYLPAVHTTWEGMECYNYSPLIYAYKCKNTAITGHGKLKAKLDTWKIWYARPPAHMNSLKHLYTLASTDSVVEKRQMVNDSANLRPQFIQFNRCENILLEDVTITNSPFWTIHPYLSKNIVIRGVNVWAHGHNNDGVDPEMSQNILIENCTFDQGDDAIAVKSGRNQDAWRLNTPTQNLIIRNCTIKQGHQLLAIGSELSGGVENVFMDNCTLSEEAKPFHIVFIKTNERRGGYVKNIYVQNIEAKELRKGIIGIETDVLYQWRDLVPTYEKRLTPINRIYLENIHAEKARFISRIQGNEELPVENVHLKNVRVETISNKTIIHKNIIKFSMEE